MHSDQGSVLAGLSDAQDQSNGVGEQARLHHLQPVD